MTDDLGTIFSDFILLRSDHRPPTADRRYLTSDLRSCYPPFAIRYSTILTTDHRYQSLVLSVVGRSSVVERSPTSDLRPLMSSRRGGASQLPVLRQKIFFDFGRAILVRAAINHGLRFK